MVRGLDELKSPVTECLDEPSLRALVDLRAGPEATQRMESLAELATEGALSERDRAQYETCVMFANFLGVLHSQARRKLETANFGHGAESVAGSRRWTLRALPHGERMGTEFRVLNRKEMCTPSKRLIDFSA